MQVPGLNQFWGSAVEVVFLSAIVVAVSAEPACLHQTFERHEKFGADYDLFWTVDKTRREIDLCMQARTKGWVAFGLTETGGMVGADILLGRFDDNDEPVLDDHFSTAFATPEPDITQDWELIRAHRNETHTGFQGRRPIESCDDEDLAFSLLPNKIIWAFGSSDLFLQHDPQNRGGGTVDFFRKEAGQDGEIIIDLTAPKETIPAVQTSYMCAFVEIPLEQDQRFHVTSYELLPSTSQHVHHVNIYKCASGAETQHGAAMNRYFDCSNEMPADCSLSLAAAAGLKKVNGWPSAGMPIGGNEDDCVDVHDLRCFRLGLFEVHFENRHRPLAPIVAPEVGYRLYVTRHLRPNDLGTMKVEVPSTGIAVPAGAKEWKVTTECGTECTSQRLSEPLNILLVAPHMHGLGSKFVLHHVRNGEAIAELGKREHGWTDDIAAVDSANAILLPGDRLVLECSYDSTQRTSTTLGGKSRMDEMCVAYLAVYPFHPGLSTCQAMAPRAPQTQYCGPADRRFDEGLLSAAELEALAADLAHPLLPYQREPFIRLESIPDPPIDLCAAVARYHVSDPEDVRAIVVGPAVVILAYALCMKVFQQFLMARSRRFREMTEPNQRNVVAYCADTIVCLIVFVAVGAYARWNANPRAVGAFDGTISAIAANTLLWSYVATLVHRSKVHLSTVLHHLATIAVIFLCNIAGYHTGAEHYAKIGALLLLMAATDCCGYVALLMHRFQARGTATAFWVSTVWNLASKTALFVAYWLVADSYPRRIRDFLDKEWTESVISPAMRTVVCALYGLQLYQVYVFYQLYLVVRNRNRNDDLPTADASPSESPLEPTSSSAAKTPAVVADVVASDLEEGFTIFGGCNAAVAHCSCAAASGPDVEQRCDIRRRSTTTGKGAHPASAWLRMPLPSTQVARERASTSEEFA